MPVLEAPRALRKRYERIRRNEGLHAFLKAVEQGHIQQRLPAKPQRREVAVKPQTPLSDPTPERASKAVDVVRAVATPFNSQVLGAAQKYAKQLGPEAMIVLEHLYALGVRGMHSRGLTASYQGSKVDVSRTSYEHLGAAERDAHERFREAMETMPPDLQRLVWELVMEVAPAGQDAPRKPVQVGGDVSGYVDHRRAHGAVVAVLRIISWCVQPVLGGPRRRR